MPILQLAISALSLLVCLLAAMLLFRRKPRAQPAAPDSGDAARRIGKVRKLLAFGAPGARKEDKEPGPSSGAFQTALKDWLNAVPQSHREVVSRVLPALQADLTSPLTDPGRAMLEALKYCLTKTDLDLDQRRKSDALQKPLKTMARLAGIEILDPEPGQMWPKSGYLSDSPRTRVGALLCRGLASDRRVLQEPEIE